MHVLVDPLQLELQLLGRVPAGAEHAEAARIGHCGDDVTAVTEGEQRKFDTEQFAQWSFHNNKYNTIPMGPLAGIKIVEIAAIGPAPFCSMMLADLGAQIVRIERASARQNEPAPPDPLLRNRRSIALDLKNAAGGRGRAEAPGTAPTC